MKKLVVIMLTLGMVCCVGAGSAFAILDLLPIGSENSGDNSGIANTKANGGADSANTNGAGNAQHSDAANNGGVLSNAQDGEANANILGKAQDADAAAMDTGKAQANADQMAMDSGVNQKDAQTNANNLSNTAVQSRDVAGQAAMDSAVLQTGNADQNGGSDNQSAGGNSDHNMTGTGNQQADSNGAERPGRQQRQPGQQ